MSSASCEICIVFSSPLTVMFNPSFAFFLIFAANISTTNKNSKAQRGQPCRIPF